MRELEKAINKAFNKLAAADNKKLSMLQKKDIERKKRIKKYKHSEIAELW